MAGYLVNGRFVVETGPTANSYIVPL